MTRFAAPVFRNPSVAVTRSHADTPLARIHIPLRARLPVVMLLLMFILPTLLLHSQNLNLGTPPIRNFSKRDYKAGTQNWDIAQDPRGVLYFANNDGLLEFDGTNWRLLTLANGTIVRSVKMGDDGKIYVGGQGDFGYFAADGKGCLGFQSLKNVLPEASRNFSDVWDILVRPEGVFFRANDRVFLFQHGRMHAYLEGVALEFMGELNGKVVVQDANARLYFFENDKFRTLGPTALPDGALVTAILPYHADTQLITTIKSGIFYCYKNTYASWKTPDDAFLKENRIYCAGLLNDGRVAIGTSLAGLVVLDEHRRIFHHLTKKNNLQNNTILSLFNDRSGNLWLGLDNGIDLVDISSPFSTIFPDGDLEGTGYAAAVFDKNIYFGTNTGLYALDWKPYYLPDENHKFRRVANSEGQVWSLHQLGSDLLMGHHEGPFVINGLAARKLTTLPGVWKFLWLNDPTTALAGHYNGVAFFKKTPLGWTFDGPLVGLAESSRILEKSDNGPVWMTHPYRGAYRLEANDATGKLGMTFFNSKNGLPTDYNNYAFKLGDNLVFATEKGVFSFDETQGRFVPNANFNEIFGEKTRVKYLRQDAVGNVWYVAGEEVGVLQVEDNAIGKKVRRQSIPELTGKLVGGFEFILPVDERNVFFATEQGFIHFDPALYLLHDSFLNVVLHEVWLGNASDSLLFGGHFTEGKTSAPVLASDQNALRFVFSATDFKGKAFLQYAHFLEGAETGWSEWSNGTELIFNNLRPGSYLLRLKARNPHGLESGELLFEFEITPPWYASPIALAVYGLLALGLVVGILHRQRQRFEHERELLQTTHRQREEQHQLFAQQSEEAINRLQNEKLEAEVQHKNQELATATMHLVQKSEILNSIKAALEKLEKRTEAGPTVQKEIARIIKLVDKDASFDEDWEQFSRNFDQVHSDFLKRLGEEFPQLSPNDFKLCAYLRMNLSTKEIAALLNISVRGVEASRYRLRKRLALDTEVNLTEFLMRL